MRQIETLSLKTLEKTHLLCPREFIYIYIETYKQDNYLFLLFVY